MTGTYRLRKVLLYIKDYELLKDNILVTINVELAQ